MLTVPFLPPSGALLLPQPYLLFLGDVAEAGYAKTALGLADWASDRCVGEYGCGAKISTGLPAMTPAEAVARGAQAMIIGVVNAGGSIPPQWRGPLVEALEAGLDIVSGMHTRLADVPELADAAERCGRRLIDVRVPPAAIPIGTGRKRGGKRLLTVGTDCAIGKKYTALALAAAFAKRGVSSDFRATGQTGIMIAGRGMPMDAVVADFETGAAELLSPDAADGHWDVIEGQGCILHPGFSPVSLGLLHGSQPDVFVVCHEPGRTRVLGNAYYSLPSVEDIIAATVLLGRRTNPSIRCGGISYNTAALDPDEAARLMAADAERHGLPVADPLRGGQAFDALVDHCLA